MCFKPILEREHDGQTSQDLIFSLMFLSLPYFRLKRLSACHCLSITPFLVLGLKTPFYFNKIHLLNSFIHSCSVQMNEDTVADNCR